jgi:hypothetical protein
MRGKARESLLAVGPPQRREASFVSRAAVKDGSFLFSGPLAGRPRDEAVQRRRTPERRPRAEARGEAQSAEQSVPGSNACVRRVAQDGHPGLARHGLRSPMLRQKLSALSQSCFARQASDSPLSCAFRAALKPRASFRVRPCDTCVAPMANPVRCVHLTLFCTPRKTNLDPREVRTKILTVVTTNRRPRQKKGTPKGP